MSGLLPHKAAFGIALNSQGQGQYMRHADGIRQFFSLSACIYESSAPT